jgi:hypothetical protein
MCVCVCARACIYTCRTTLNAWRMKLITVKAVGLRVADVSGSSDPYLVFQVLFLSPSKMCSLLKMCV